MQKYKLAQLVFLASLTTLKGAGRLSEDLLLQGERQSQQKWKDKRTVFGVKKAYLSGPTVFLALLVTCEVVGILVLLNHLQKTKKATLISKPKPNAA